LVHDNVSEVITEELPEYLKKVFNLSIETEILYVREGSIIIFVGVTLLGIYNFIANYKNFFESINLIKTQINPLIEEKLKDISNDDFEIKIETVVIKSRYKLIIDLIRIIYNNVRDRYSKLSGVFYLSLGDGPLCRYSFFINIILIGITFYLFYRLLISR
jgi:hypothetical protein